MTNTEKRGFPSTDEKKEKDLARKGGGKVPAEEKSFSKERNIDEEKKSGKVPGGKR